MLHFLLLNRATLIMESMTIQMWIYNKNQDKWFHFVRVFGFSSVITLYESAFMAFTSQLSITHHWSSMSFRYWDLSVASCLGFCYRSPYFWRHQKSREKYFFKLHNVLSGKSCFEMEYLQEYFSQPHEICQTWRQTCFFIICLNEGCFFFLLGPQNGKKKSNFPKVSDHQGL